jgi:cellulose synthase/poly-beta-1,6-N-acetylglucosamine synthase-like glycosyltransferase
MALVEIAFWASVGLLVYTHLGYPLLLAGLSALRRTSRNPPYRGQRGTFGGGETPRVSLIVAAHDEADVIAGWVANALAMDYPRERLEVVVACDGCADDTPARAREAGADRVLELERGGKVAALNAAVAGSESKVLAFADANARWQPDALRRLAARLETDGVGYVCGQVRFTASDGAANEEGLYWRYEMAVRRMESELAGITAGNGAINAVRREAYIALEPERGQDISFPFELAKRGWRALYEPEALATEPMAPTIEGEFRRKRRMMAGAWNTILRTGLLSPRGYRPLYAVEIYSHRLLRYATPILHLLAFGTNLALLGEGTVYAVTLAAQLALVAAAVAGRALPLRPLLIARYYAAVTIASAVGLWDLLRRGVPRTWESVEGTR